MSREGGHGCGLPGPPAQPQPLTVGGNVDFLRKFCHIHFKPVLNIIEDFGIIFIRHKSDGQALSAKAPCTGHLQADKSRGQATDIAWGPQSKQSQVPTHPTSVGPLTR